MKILMIGLILISLNIHGTGAIIAFSGLAGSGKSTMARLLAQEIHAHCSAEPEEHEWPNVIKNPQIYGASTAILGLRQLWIQQFIDADVKRKNGEVVILDPYFLKITGYYLDLPGMEWLIAETDPYRSFLKELFLLDQILIPDADCVVLFEVSSDDGRLFLQSRGRNWDKDPAFLKSYETNRNYIKTATQAHCDKNGIPLLYFDHHFGDPVEQVQRLKELILSFFH